MMRLSRQNVIQRPNKALPCACAIRHLERFSYVIRLIRVDRLQEQCRKFAAHTIKTTSSNERFDSKATAAQGDTVGTDGGKGHGAPAITDQG